MNSYRKIVEISKIIPKLESPDLIINLLETGYISESELITVVGWVNKESYRQEFSADLLNFLLEICKNDPNAVSHLFYLYSTHKFPIEFLFEYEHIEPIWDVIYRLDYDQFIEYVSLMKIDIKMNSGRIMNVIYFTNDSQLSNWLIENLDLNILIIDGSFHMDDCSYDKYMPIYRRTLERAVSTGIRCDKLDSFLINPLFCPRLIKEATIDGIIDDVCDILEDNAYQITHMSRSQTLVHTYWNTYVNEDNNYCIERLQYKLRFIDNDVLNEIIAEKLSSI